MIGQRQASAGKGWAASVAGLGLLWCAPAAASPTPAGAAITNVATLRYDLGGGATTVSSNMVTLVAAELLDVSVTAAGSGTVPTDAQVTAVAFEVFNAGNGDERYRLTAHTDPSAIAIIGLAADTNGDGQFTAGTDAAIADGSILLAPGQRARVFVLVAHAVTDGDARVSLDAAAIVGVGAPGSSLDGKGANGADIVIGPSGGHAGADSMLVAAAPSPTLRKEQQVIALDGSARPLRGATITYRLTASFPGAQDGVAIDDPIPAGTAYLPGSLTLDDQPLSDGSDADAGTADASGIRVALGHALSGASHTVTFSVKIQ